MFDLFNIKKLKMKKQELEQEIVQLRQYVVDVNEKNAYGNSPIILASKHGHLNIVKMLVEKGANINVQNELDGSIL